MIRFLGLLLIFALGLAGAALWQGQMHHLRRAAPEALPGWSKAISDTSGLRQGRLVQAAQGALPELALEWTARAPGGEGLLWDVRITGRGVDLQAELLLPYWPGTAIIRNGTGSLDLADLTGSGIGGLVAVTGLAGEISDLFGAPAPTGTLSAEARGISADGAALGAGPLEGVLNAAGDWQIDLALSGGVSPVQGRISGALPDTGGLIEVTIAEVSALPAATRQMLSAIGSPDGSGLRLSLPLALWR